jgi:hypothetical protein
MGLPDLVQAKKTQPDKDWPMIRRLVEVNYFAETIEIRRDRRRGLQIPTGSAFRAKLHRPAQIEIEAM